MSLRLVIGKNPHPMSSRGWKILYQSPHILLEGSPNFVTVRPQGKKTHFFIGDLVGTYPASFEDQGGNLRDQLEGRFVLVSLEGDSGQLITDRFGQIDIYFQKWNDQTIFATDLSLLPFCKGKKEYDFAALAHTLCVYGYRPPKQHTLYKGISRLGVGQEVRIKEGQVQFTEIPFCPQPMREDFEERELHQYADILLEAVRLRGSPHGNVVSLSSGWDSTALLACLVKIFGPKKVRGVIGRMIYSERSGVVNQFELDRARAIADYFKVKLDIVDFDYRQDVGEQFAKIRPWLQAHQLNTFTALSVSLLAEHVAKTSAGDEVLFTGEISDGVHNLGFSQYSTFFHPSYAFREYADKMAGYLFGPTFFSLFETNQFDSDVVYQIFRRHFKDYFFDEPSPDPLARRRQFLASFFMRFNRVPLWSLGNTKMLTTEGRSHYSEEVEQLYLARTAKELKKETLYPWLLHLYNSFHWQSAPVAQRAILARQHGLGLAVPFWDSRLQDFLAQMPENAGRGLDFHPTKYPLKWALQNRIDYPYFLQEGPHSYLSDVDARFSHSVEILYASSFAPHFKEQLKKRLYHHLLSPSFFNLEYIDRIVDRYLVSEEVSGAPVNELLSLCSLLLVGLYE